jgi:hypothetical protein
MYAGLIGGLRTLITQVMCLKKTHCISVQHNCGEKINLKNKRVIISEFPNAKNVRKHQSEKAELGFKRLVTDSGCSKKVAKELLKWYGIKR